MFRSFKLTLIQTGVAFFITQGLFAAVNAHFRGQFGNQLFQAAAAISLALENNCEVNFPDFVKLSDPNWGKGWDLRDNYNRFLRHLPHQSIDKKPSFLYQEPPGPCYYPIPYQPEIEIEGYFLSEKYFFKYRNLIKKLFAPPKEIEKDLIQDFSWLIDQDKTVAVHVRTGYYDFLKSAPDFYSRYPPPDFEYYKRAMELFDPDSTFVVFSDYLPLCKKQFQDTNRKIIFIEGQDHIHDFYLITFCKHVIIANSTFGWWAAYLNTNPSKKVVCRDPFYGSWNEKSDDALCDDWIRLPMSLNVPPPVF